jgi:putative Holliday junction resolvase
VRVVGLDLGSRRIGVATTDAGGRLASPHTVMERRGSREADHEAIAAVVRDLEAELVVVGLPLSLDGTIGPAAQAAVVEVAELADVLPVPVETYDERLTTVTADRSLSQLGLRGQARRKVVDKVAAAVMLQAWLDHRNRGNPPDR